MTKNVVYLTGRAAAIRSWCKFRAGINVFILASLVEQISATF